MVVMLACLGDGGVALIERDEAFRLEARAVPFIPSVFRQGDVAAWSY